MVKVYDNLVTSTDIYTMKGFCRVFKVLLISRLWLSYFPIKNITISNFPNNELFLSHFIIISIYFSQVFQS